MGSRQKSTQAGSTEAGQRMQSTAGTVIMGNYAGPKVEDVHRLEKKIDHLQKMLHLALQGNYRTEKNPFFLFLCDRFERLNILPTSKLFLEMC